ncbi:hypothetical protein EV424DRAFT_1347524 [Suillus variegatus]|nr:hypothetical protein EV424DRAFT_1347524 [Suillus variegatus]
MHRAFVVVGSSISTAASASVLYSFKGGVYCIHKGIHHHPKQTHILHLSRDERTRFEQIVFENPAAGPAVMTALLVLLNAEEAMHAKLYATVGKRYSLMRGCFACRFLWKVFNYVQLAEVPRFLGIREEHPLWALNQIMKVRMSIDQTSNGSRIVTTQCDGPWVPQESEGHTNHQGYNKCGRSICGPMHWQIPRQPHPKCHFQLDVKLLAQYKGDLTAWFRDLIRVNKEATSKTYCWRTLGPQSSSVMSSIAITDGTFITPLAKEAEEQYSLVYNVVGLAFCDPTPKLAHFITRYSLDGKRVYHYDDLWFLEEIILSIVFGVGSGVFVYVADFDNSDATSSEFLFCRLKNVRPLIVDVLHRLERSREGGKENSH